MRDPRRLCRRVHGSNHRPGVVTDDRSARPAEMRERGRYAADVIVEAGLLGWRIGHPEAGHVERKRMEARIGQRRHHSLELRP